jgi:hypothetical protein
MNRRLARAISILKSSPLTEHLAPTLQECYDEARRAGFRQARLACLIIGLAVPALVFVWVVWRDPDLIGEVLNYFPSTLVEVFILRYPLALLTLALAILGIWWTRRLVLSHALSRFLTDRLDADPEQVMLARRAIAVSRPEILFRLTWAVVSVFLVAVGALWAAIIFLATSEALSCARSSKCL